MKDTKLKDKLVGWLVALAVVVIGTIIVTAIFGALQRGVAKTAPMIQESLGMESPGDRNLAPTKDSSTTPTAPDVEQEETELPDEPITDMPTDEEEDYTDRWANQEFGYLNEGIGVEYRMHCANQYISNAYAFDNVERSIYDVGGTDVMVFGTVSNINRDGSITTCTLTIYDMMRSRYIDDEISILYIGDLKITDGDSLTGFGKIELPAGYTYQSGDPIPVTITDYIINAWTPYDYVVAHEIRDIVINFHDGEPEWSEGEWNHWHNGADFYTVNSDRVLIDGHTINDEPFTVLQYAYSDQNDSYILKIQFDNYADCYENDACVSYLTLCEGYIGIHNTSDLLSNIRVKNGKSMGDGMPIPFQTSIGATKIAQF